MTEQYPVTEAGQHAKAQANRAMFDGIASRYDLLNGFMSLGLDRGWRRRLVDLCAVGRGSHCLDLCCGTGAVAREMTSRGARVIGLDASGAMVAAARARGGAEFVQGDALAMPFAARIFDVVTIAFGNRNVASLERLYAEMRRVAKPGGRVASLEINRPSSPLLCRLFFLYFARVPALLARLCGADPAAYTYLPASVMAYPSPEEVAAIMQQAGLTGITIERHLGGAVVIHRGIA